MNRNEQLVKQIRQIFNDICRHFHTHSLPDPERDQLTCYCILESLIACPSEDEISHSLNLLSLNHESLILPGQRPRDRENEKNRKILAANLNKHTPKHLSTRPNETLAQTCETLLSKRTRKEIEVYAEHIKTIQALIFEGTEYSSTAQEQLITHWRRLCHKADPPAKSKKFKPPILKGRRKDAEFIDICTASRIILYFIETFINTPHEIKYGATACFLWLMLRITLQDIATIPVIEELLSLKIENLRLTNDQLYIHDREIPISTGLSRLLAILMHSRPKDAFAFFDISPDWLQDQFKKASQSLSKDPHLIAPSAFHIFPHLHLGHRIPQTLIRNRRQKLILSKQHFYESILYSLKLPMNLQHTDS